MSTYSPWVLKGDRCMSWNVLISFGIGVGIWILGILVFGLIKRHRNKKRFEKENKEHEQNEN